jgi:hypothetical protein
MPPAPRTRVIERMEPVAASYGIDLDPVHARLDQMDNALRRMQADMATDRRMLADLVRDLQRDLAQPRTGGPGLPAGFVERIDDRMSAIERSLSAGLKNVDKLVATGIASGSGDGALAELVTQQLVEVTDQVKTATDRLQALERTMETRQGELKTALGSDLRGMIERAMSTQTQGGGVLQSLLNDRLGSISQQFDQQNLSITSAVAQLTEPLLERMRSVEQSGQQQAQVVRAVGEKSAQLEQLLRGFGEQNTRTVQGLVEQVSTAHQAELRELHDALLKLGQNQQTLAENLEQWRAENEGGMSIVSNRLELLERASAQPLAMLKQVQTDIQHLQQVAVADYDQNNQGFFVWLFGTKDPLKGAWRDETAQIRARLRQMREERKA